MKKLKFAVILSSFLAVSTSSFAEGSLSDQSIQGTWALEYTKKDVKSGSKVTREDTWVFNNGTVVIKHIPREGGYYDLLNPDQK
jgi:hypothetical protein